MYYVCLGVKNMSYSHFGSLLTDIANCIKQSKIIWTDTIQAESNFETLKL